jgi:hypothetical protein
MAAERKSTGTIVVTLDSEEAAELLRLVESALGETRVELHHTHTPNYRERVQKSEALLRAVLERLRKASD